ncbi:hypothetical protein EJ07DRAFT_104029 [Lizonia empirigonia]|nr:hypothetical protein EJ07DRAFT_104029 [Lizonia empirigonia]
MAKISILNLLALGATVLASTPSPNLDLRDSLQPSHLPWAWNTSFPITHTSNSTNSTLISKANSTFMVTVGDRGELIFSPPSLNASVGSIIAFNFLASNHTLTQSNLTDPCHSNGGFDSGFSQFNPLNISGKNVVEFKVQTNNPQWFFCAQRMKMSHCHAGMVFSLNPGGNQSKFLQNARTTNVIDAQPTLACSHLASDVSTTTIVPNSTISAKVEPSSTVIVPPIADNGGAKPAMGLSLLACLYVLFL